MDLIQVPDIHEYGAPRFGGDGVLRSHPPSGTVLDCMKLDCDRIQHVVDRFGGNDNIAECQNEVNGHNVCRPGPDLRPYMVLFSHIFTNQAAHMAEPIG